MTEDPFVASAEVRAARAQGRPIVALESTIITHGMPWPQNLQMAQEVEAIVREAGAVPATIAVLNGTLRVGLDGADLETLARSSGAMKLSRADLAFAVATGRTGSTTVAATMIAAARAGIAVFATGGIGGVHRGAAETFDISADLDELARTRCIVVCAGAKAILDLRKTFEVLETKGVPVVVHGADEIPAFWSRRSGIPAPLRLDAAGDIAKFQREREQLGLDGGMLVANPVPHVSEIPADEIGHWIEVSLQEAEANAITGKAVTPYLLGRMLALSEGRSLVTNIALVRSNARLAAEIAVALSA